MRYTPMPWKVEQIHDRFHGLHLRVIKLLGNSRIRVIGHIGYDWVTPEVEGNGRLIGLAPEMYEAIREFVREADAYPDDRVGTVISLAGLEEVLAKVEG